MTLLVLTPPSVHDSNQFLNAFSTGLPERFSEFQSLSSEALNFRGSCAVCTRFLFTRDKTPWIALMLLLAGQRYCYVWDVSGEGRCIGAPVCPPRGSRYIHGI